jgi:hypothetical protein
MARIRTIKPEFWSSAQLLECSPIARLLFIGMWNFADDKGRLPYSVKSIKAQIFPADGFDLDTVEGWIVELSTNDLVLPYEVDGKRYLQITGWHHQRIDKPQPAKYPDPPKERSQSVRGMLPPDRKGKEGNGKEGNQDAAPVGAHAGELDLGQTAPAKPPNPQRSDPETELFQRGREILGKSAGGLISQLLKAKGKPELARAAMEVAATKENPREYIGAILRGSKESEDDGIWRKAHGAIV